MLIVIYYFLVIKFIQLNFTKKCRKLMQLELIWERRIRVLVFLCTAKWKLLLMIKVEILFEIFYKS